MKKSTFFKLISLLCLLLAIILISFVPGEEAAETTDSEDVGTGIYCFFLKNQIDTVLIIYLQTYIYFFQI